MVGVNRSNNSIFRQVLFAKWVGITYSPFADGAGQSRPRAGRLQAFKRTKHDSRNCQSIKNDGRFGAVGFGSDTNDFVWTWRGVDTRANAQQVAIT